MTRRLTLLYDVIWIRPDKPDDHAGSIFIPETCRMRLWQGTIVNIGPGLRPGYDHQHLIQAGEDRGRMYVARRWDGKTLFPLDVKVGDRVLMEREQAETIKVDGEWLWICRYNNLVAVIEDGVRHVAGDWSLSDKVEICDLP
jgi:co-chaperonin GroES (HSP10)